MNSKSTRDDWHLSEIQIYYIQINYFKKRLLHVARRQLFSYGKENFLSFCFSPDEHFLIFFSARKRVQQNLDYQDAISEKSFF